jgi:hypothetical protein
MRDVTIGLGELPLAGLGKLSLAQENGGAPTLLTSGSAPGESGVSVVNVRFQGGMHLAATLGHHLICFQHMDGGLRFECRMADTTLSHEPPPGSLAICPAGIDCTADTNGSVDAILVAIDPGQMALAAAEDSALEAQLIERLSGYDQPLLELACILAFECVHDYPNGPTDQFTLLGVAMLGAGMLPSGKPVVTGSVTAPPKGPTIQFGEYILSYQDCRECHGVRLTGGVPGQMGPLGPDLNLVKGWKLAEFIATMRTGIDPSGYALSEQMPWRPIGRMDDDELTAIYEYLTHLPSS